MTDSMFEPLQQMITLLKVFEQELPNVVYKQLEVRAWLSFSPSLYCHVLFLIPPLDVPEILHFLCAVQLPICSLFPGTWQFIICQSCCCCFSSPSPSRSDLFLCLSCLTPAWPAGVAGEVDKFAQAGDACQTAVGATAGHWGGWPASEVCFVWCGAEDLQGEFSDQRALQVARYVKDLLGNVG